MIIIIYVSIIWPGPYFTSVEIHSTVTVWCVFRVEIIFHFISLYLLIYLLKLS